MSSTFDLNFRTDDLTRWGDGLGRNLHPTEIDLNFWILLELFLSLEENPAQPAQIQDITVDSESRMTITLNDMPPTSFGPFQLPTATFTWRGNWTPLTDYTKYDLFNQSTGLFLVLQTHTSNSSFNSTDGNMAGNFYKLLVQYPVSYDIGFFFPGLPGQGIAAGQPIFAYATRSNFFLNADLPDSIFSVDTAFTNSTEFDITQNGTQIGSLTFGAGQTSAVISFLDDVQFVSGDVLTVTSPASVDSTGANFTATFAATKGDLEGPSSS